MTASHTLDPAAVAERYSGRPPKCIECEKPMRLTRQADGETVYRVVVWKCSCTGRETPQITYTPTNDPEVVALCDEVARLRAVYDAARGLCFGFDWNNGTQAKIHGFRLKLLQAVDAIERLPDNRVSGEESKAATERAAAVPPWIDGPPGDEPGAVVVEDTDEQIFIGGWSGDWFFGTDEEPCSATILEKCNIVRHRRLPAELLEGPK